MADAFADILAPPPPPPPRAGFADTLAAAFGAGPNNMAAYQKGVDTAGQYKLRSAQTESALAEADKRRGEALRQSQVNDLVTRAQNDPNFQPTVTDLLTLSNGANDFSRGRLGFQEFDQRATLGDPNAAPAAQFAAGQGVQGKVLPQTEALGAGREIDLLTQQPQTNPIGEAQIANYQESPGGGAAGGPLIRSSPIGPVQSFDGGKTWNPVLANQDVAGFNAARTGGAATGQKQAALYANLNNIDSFTADVDALLAHPGFAEVYGLSSALDPRNYIRGTDAQGAAALRDKLNSRSFLTSIQSMRGMGALSNQEGSKVETALTAALKPGLGDEEAALRLSELKTAIANLRRVAEQEANATENVLSPPTGASSATLAFATVQEAEAANLPPGTRITVGGRAATVQ